MNRATPHRRGATLLNTITATAALLFALYFVIAGCDKAVTSGRQNTCRSNLSNLTTAAILYDGRNGKLPGYMNCLITQQGEAYRDPDTNELTPVSWVVELLTDLDRGPLYEMWRSSSGTNAPAAAQPSATGTGATAFRPRVKIYLEILTCPNDPSKVQLSGTPLSYVANTGMPDLPQAIPASAGANGNGETVGFPRDWQANGMFFDNYSDDKLIKLDPKTRGPQVVTRLSRIRDPKDKTILFTENLDATSYVFDNWRTPASAEVAWGSVWAPGKSTPNPVAAQPTGTRSFEDILYQSTAPILEPRDDVSAPNAHNDGRKHPLEYKYCRPSSPHPDGFNVAFAGKNVMFINDKISYFVYSRLMASDDAGAKLPGSQVLIDANFRGYQIDAGDEIKP
jgi:hypothetical protein